MPKGVYKRKPFSEEHRRRIGESNSISMLGHFVSEESKIKMSEAKKGSKHPMWKGGIKNDKYGYRLVKSWDHPNCATTGYVLEHRLIMEKHLGRYLTKKEVVHHINDIRDDNRMENLELFATVGEHTKFHFLRSRLYYYKYVILLCF